MRIKKSVPVESSPEDAAVEQRVEIMMNPALPDGNLSQPTPASNKPLDIFQGLSANPSTVKIATTAPTINGMSASPVASPTPKSLFGSIDDLNRPSATKKLLAPPIAAKQPLILPVATGPLPKPKTLGGAPPTAADNGVAVSVDSLARKESFTDSATETAVEDIMSHEGDDLLVAEDRLRGQSAMPIFVKPKRGARLRRLLSSRWMLLIIPIVLIALAAVPVTRYKLAGFVIKKTLGVTVVDSVTGKPISGASVSYGGHQATTNATGQALLAAPLGGGELSITKGYYAPYNKTTTIGIGDPSPALKISLVATGRQVSLTILNKLTKEPVTGAIVKVLETSAVTNKAGEVSIVLPTKTDTVTATITAEGYTTSTAQVQVTDGVVPANTISIVPAGKLYFLSTANGTQDVVKSNLDGSDRSVVLAGTGKEDAATSQLIASRDWRYVVVKTRRTATETSLYLIDTATDKQTQFEATNSAYNLIGWSGHNFVYDVVRSTVAASQSGRESIKSYNADQQQLNQLDQTQALGAAASYAALTFSNFFIVDNQLLYTTKWTGGGDTAYDLSSQTNSIRTISVSGQGKKDLQSYPAATFAGIQTAHVLPGRVIYLVASTDGAATYYSYTGGSLSADTSLNPDSFAQPSPVYLPSPDGLKTAWSTVSGKPGLMVGDKNGSNPTSVSGGEYGAYGWYGSKYILLSRGGSSLYILPLGEGKNYTPTKVGDYSQQQIAPASYGGGF